MRAAQKAKLNPIAQKHGWSLSWHDSLDGLHPDAEKFTLLLAHEFFDALPFHLLQVRASLISCCLYPRRYRRSRSVVL